ncbi:MAG: DmsE family decaheme c-type cytochrome [Wenzhouxiangellaceae bacterium]|nr:DmsE family decaheme c-type cytochrome [Wenzhouxiangellaceae bacterium]
MVTIRAIADLRFMRLMLWTGLLGSTLLASNALLAQDEEAEEPPEYSRGGADTCLRCHGDEESAHILEIFEGPHGVMADQRTPFGGTQCEACHGPGDEHAGRVGFGQERPPIPAFGANSRATETEENEICLSCHRGTGTTHRFWEGGTHERQDVGCTDCHSAHVRKDPVTVASTQPEVCFECHVQQRAEVHRAYAHPIRFGEMGCTSCHEPHGSPSEAMLANMNVNQNCYECHAEQRGPYLWEHAPVTEDCTLCHNAHGSNNPALLTRRAPLLCQQCHSRLGHPGVGLTGNDLPSGNASAFLLSGSCTSCHSQVHGSNHPSGATLNR